MRDFEMRNKKIFSTCRAVLQCLLMLLAISRLVRADEDDTTSRETGPEDLGAAPACGRMPIPGYPSYYLEMTGFFFNTVRCPFGSEFDPMQCDCIFFKQAILPVVVTEAPSYSYTAVAVTTAPAAEVDTEIQPAPTVKSISATSTVRYTDTPKQNIVQVLFDTATPKPDATPVVFVKQPVVVLPSEVADFGMLSKKSVEIICSGCRFEGGIGFKRHDRDCDKYVMCYVTGTSGDLRAAVRTCGVGEYWDQALLTCRNSSDVPCPNEKCKGKENSYTYGFPGDCRAYWQCERGVSVGHCCPKGQGYTAGVGCRHNPLCDSRCGSQTTQEVGCDKVPFPGTPQKFRQFVEGHGLVDMNCADGTIFDRDTCNCVTDTSVTPYPGCRKELDVTFNDKLIDVSGRKVHVTGVNLTYIDKTACFHGDGAIVVPRFANAEIGRNLDIKLRFKVKRLLGDDEEAIIYNGDCGMEPSIVVAVSRDKIIFTLRNKNNSTGTAILRIPINANNWITGRFSLHKDVMTMSVNGRTERRLFFGEIARSRCGLKIGWGKEFQSFNGCISKLSISFCPDALT